MGDSDSFLHGFELPSLLLSERESKAYKKLVVVTALLAQGFSDAFANGRVERF